MSNAAVHKFPSNLLLTTTADFGKGTWFTIKYIAPPFTFHPLPVQGHQPYVEAT